MKKSYVTTYCLQYQKVNSKKNTIITHEFIFGKFENT